MILRIYLSTSGLAMIVAAVPVFVQDPGGVVHTPVYWIFFGISIVQFAAAAPRRLPFVTRFATLASTLLAMMIIGAMTAGITPTWVAWTAMFLTSTAMLFGVEAGLAGIAVVILGMVVIAWGWTRGYLPIALTAPQDAEAFYDYGAATVWVRVITTTAIFIAGLLVLMRYVLSSLSQALRDSTDSLNRLAAEQERREAVVEALRVSEGKFTKLYQVSPISVVVSELGTGRILEVNQAFLETYECTRERVIGHTTVELNLWRDVRERSLLVARMRAETPVRDFRVKGRTVMGRAITVLVNCELVDFGGQECMLTMVQDITEQERAEQALRDSEEKFSRAFRSGPNAMAISEFETGRFIDINESFERLFGYSRKETLGRTSIEIGIWRAAADREIVMKLLAETGSLRDYELTTLNRRGESVTYVVCAECLMLGGKRCVVMSAQDITARTRAEAEHAAAVEREMKARAEFTRRLIGAEEAERRRIAAELHDSLGQNLLLLKNRAHLALTDGTVPPGLHWQFESIEKLAGDAIAEVRQISHDLHPYQLDQLGLTGALEGMISLAGRNSGFVFEHRLESVDDLFSGEAATHLFRIVQECVNNILRHSRARRATILLERDIRHVRVRVADDGCGFAVGGRGFGLNGIAERTRILGGKLEIDSAPGRGTRIEVLVPIEADA